MRTLYVIKAQLCLNKQVLVTQRLAGLMEYSVFLYKVFDK